jgi:hypothetical protein
VEKILGAMQTPDGAWRVEIIYGRGGRRYRLVHGDNIIDWLAIGSVEYLLDQAGVDRSTLVEVRDEPEEEAGGQHGAA